MPHLVKKSRNGRRISQSVGLGSIVTFAVLYSPQPVAHLLSAEWNVSPAAAGASISVATFPLAFAALLVPALSSIWGRVAIMRWSLVFASVFAILSAFAANVQQFLVFRLLIGLSAAGFPAAAMAHLTAEFYSKDAMRQIGLYVAGTAVGGFAGRMLVGAGADLFGWRAGVLALGAASLGCSIAFWLRLPESSNGRPRSRPFFGSWLIGLRTSFSSRRLLALYAMGFSLMGVYVAIFNYIGYALNVTPYSIGQTALGLLFVVNLVGTWSSVLFGRLAARRSRRFALVLATLIALGGIALAGLDSLAAKVVGCGAVAFGFFAGHAVASGWVGLLAPGQAKESAPAVYLLFYYAGSSIVGWTGGIVLRQYGWDGLVGAGFVLLASTLATTYPLLRTAFSTSPAAVGEPAHTNSPTHSRRT